MKKWTLTGIVSGATLVIASLGMLAQGAINLDKKLGDSQAERDSLYSEVRQLSRRVARIEVKTGIKKGKIVRQKDQHRVGIFRRVVGIIF